MGIHKKKKIGLKVKKYKLKVLNIDLIMLFDLKAGYLFC